MEMTLEAERLYFEPSFPLLMNYVAHNPARCQHAPCDRRWYHTLIRLLWRSHEFCMYSEAQHYISTQSMSTTDSFSSLVPGGMKSKEWKELL